MTGDEADRAAAALQEVRQRRGHVAPLPAPIAPRTEVEGAAVQRALAHRTGAASPGGFKIGATAKRMQEYLGLSGPAAGFMAVGNLYRSGASERFADFVRPGVECELAVRLARDLPPGPRTAEQAADAVGELFAGIEIVENRYGELLELGVPTLIADQVFHAAAGTRSARCGGLALAGHWQTARPADRGWSPTRRRRRCGPDGSPDELPGVAGWLFRRRGFRRAESGPGDNAWQRHAARLADRAGQRHGGFLATAAGSSHVHLMFR